MRTIEKVCQRLDEKHRDLRYAIDDSTITVLAPHAKGFTVWLTESDREWVVGYDGWHHHFTDEANALDCFGFAFSGNCRLRVCLRGQCEYRWTLEVFQDGEWSEDSTTGILVFPFWRSKRIEYRHNVAPESGPQVE